MEQNNSKDNSSASIKRKDPYLVLTPLDLQYPLYENIYLSGEWCKTLSDNKFADVRYEVIPYHWSNRKKFHRDYEYLYSLVERTLSGLSVHLNQYHTAEYSNRFWRILLGPWLITYIPVIWERWEAMRLSSEKLKQTFHTSLAPDLEVPPKDFEIFRSFLDSDEWNHLIFSRILKFIVPQNDLSFNLLDRQKIILGLGLINHIQSKKKSGLKNLMYQTIVLFDHLIQKALNLFKYKRKFTFFHTYFPKKFSIRLLLRLKTLPLFNGAFRSDIQYPKASLFDRSAWSDIKVKPQNDFEKFLFRFIMQDMPIAYLEGFSHLEQAQRGITNSQNILTANAHWYNELFKIWTAHQVEQHATLIISEHGGAFPLTSNLMNHPEKISDKFICWGQETHKNHHRLPPNKIGFIRKRGFKNTDNITLVDFESVRYGYRAVAAPVGPLVLDVYNRNIEFISKLKPKILKDFRVKPKYLGSWGLEHGYKKEFGQKIISPYTNMRSILNNSKLLISPYPQTVFSEGMFSSVPTILIFNPEYWDIDPKYQTLMEVLKNAKIAHTDPESAALHINDIAQDINVWWTSQNVVEARELFQEICLTISRNPIEDWKIFLSNMGNG